MTPDATLNATAYWDATYREKVEVVGSWTENVLRESLSFIARADVNLDDAIIDVGGGGGHLVEELLACGYPDITVLDVSPTAIDEARR